MANNRPRTPGIIDRLGEWRDINRVAEPMYSVSRTAYAYMGDARPAVERFLRGKWLGHPLHPSLVDIPIGAYTSVCLFDALALLHPPFKRAADVSLTAGLLSAPLAAAAGHADWMQMEGRAKRIGVVHGSLNTFAYVLYVMSALHRLRGQRFRGVSTAGLAMAVSTAAAYLGGALVFNEGAGVQENEAEE